jgi:hypothetical protein
MATHVVGMQVATHNAVWKRMEGHASLGPEKNGSFEKICTIDVGHASLGPQMNKLT